VIEKIKIIENLELIGICTKFRIYFLDLKNNFHDVNSIEIRKDSKLYFSISKDKTQMLSFNEGNYYNGVIQRQYLTNNFTPPDKISIEGDIKGVKIINHKYVLIKQSFVLEYQEVGEHNGYWDRLVLLDFDKAFEYLDSQEGEVHFLKKPTKIEVNPNPLPGEYIVFKVHEKITSHWIASARGLE
jgi:hypothetical protein